MNTTPGPAAALSVSKVYEILAMQQLAGSRWPLSMMDNHVLWYQFAGGSKSVESRPQKAGVSGVASPWRNSAKLSCVWAHSIQSRASNARPALMKSISISTLNSEGARKRGSEVTAALTDAPERSVKSQSSADYVARGERGDPRGRKSGGGLETTNLRWPARAEGEKRFRSATRNP
jgi:hypothetical protein